MSLPHNKVLEVEDFGSLTEEFREVFPHEIDRQSPEWPRPYGNRKYWEVVMAVRALREGGVLRPDAEVLGVGAGNEPTTFYLTNHVRRVFCTDLYIPPSASPVQRHQAAKDAAQQAEQQAEAQAEAARQWAARAAADAAIVPPRRSLFRKVGSAVKQAARGARAGFRGPAATPTPAAPESPPAPPSPSTTGPTSAWEEVANAGMFLHPGRYWPSSWQSRRLVVQHMNGLDLQYEDASMDGLYSCGSIEHFGTHEDVRQAASEMARVLKPGGVASIATEFRLDGPSPGVPGTLMFDEDELRTFIFDAGDWELVGGSLRTECSETTRALVEPFEKQAEYVYAEFAKHGDSLFHEIEPGFALKPVVSLQGRTFTSVHFALRKRS